MAAVGVVERARRRGSTAGRTRARSRVRRGRTTRAISAIPFAGSPTLRMPKEMLAMSNESSSNGSAVTSATSNVMSLDFCRASSIISGVKSVPTTRPLPTALLERDGEVAGAGRAVEHAHRRASRPTSAPPRAARDDARRRRGPCSRGRSARRSIANIDLMRVGSGPVVVVGGQRGRDSSNAVRKALNAQRRKGRQRGYSSLVTSRSSRYNRPP